MNNNTSGNVSRDQSQNMDNDTNGDASRHLNPDMNNDTKLGASPGGRKRIKEIKRPDWKDWGKRGEVSLAEAVMLSLDLLPEKHLVDNPFSELFVDPPRSSSTRNPAFDYTPFRSRYELALSCLKQPDFPEICPPYRSGIIKGMPCINLKDFGTWAKSVWDDLPDQFPSKQDTASEVNGLVSTIPFLQKLAAFYNKQNLPQDVSATKRLSFLLSEEIPHVHPRVAHSLITWMSGREKPRPSKQSKPPKKK